MYQETDRESIEQWESDIANSQIVFFFCQFIIFKFTHGNNYYYLYRADSIGSGGQS